MIFGFGEEERKKFRKNKQEKQRKKQKNASRLKVGW